MVDMKVGDLVRQNLTEDEKIRGLGMITKVYLNGSTPEFDNRRIWVYWFESGKYQSIGHRWLEVIDESR